MCLFSESIQPESHEFVCAHHSPNEPPRSHSKDADTSFLLMNYAETFHARGALTILQPYVMIMHPLLLLCFTHKSIFVYILARTLFPATSTTQPRRLNRTRVMVSLFLTFCNHNPILASVCTLPSDNNVTIRYSGGDNSLPSQMLQSSKVMGLLHRNEGSRRPLSALRKRIRSISAR